MSYEAWRISFQLSEQAARSAYEQACSIGVDLDKALEAKAQYQVLLADMTERCNAAEKQRDKLLAALTKAREDMNWMLNSKRFLNSFVFGYIDNAIARVKDGAA